ncbi:MAG: OmpA family protein [Deltaproteobacteria bacterium]|nr:OmpA family protein [Deltaproteobacteria bacterium]
MKHQSLTMCSMGLVALLSACVSTGTHEAVVKELEKTRADLESTKVGLTKERDDVQAKVKTCDENLTTALDQNQQLVTKVASMGQNVEQLLGEKGELAKERERLESEQKNMAKEVDELKRMRAAAEKRNAEYQTLIGKLAKMIDAGTLQVKVRNGRMLVQLSSDVVFPPGGTKIKPEGKEAFQQIADAIKQFPDRKFQVIGHSDSTPIRTERFPSNWELSMARSLEVVKLLIEAGVPPTMLSAAGAAEFDPLGANDTEENKAMNRRVELVFVPKIDELPGMSEVLKKK